MSCCSNKKYSNVNDLISEDKKAKEYFMTLPDYIQGEVNLHSDSIHSLNELQNYAENIVSRRRK